MELIKLKNNALKLILLITLSVSLQTQAQTTHKQTGNSYVTVAGTSTLHDWTMTSKETEVRATFETAPDGTPLELKALSLSIPSQSLKSGKNAMDKNAYSALKADKNKTISFNLTTASVKKGVILCSGTLLIAGVTKKINVETTCEVRPDGSMHYIGSKPFKMSEFQVKPPSFMFGTVKTGDDITITFNIELSPVKIINSKK